MKNSDVILYEFLVNSEYLTKDEFSALTEDSKTHTLSSLTSSILKTVNEKGTSIDTSLIDRSRGDIRQFKDMSYVTDALTTIEKLANTPISPKLSEDVRSLSKTVQYLTQFAPQFKDAYRNRKTLLILRYQSLILSVISATAYLISSVIDLSSGKPELNLNPTYEDIAPFRTVRSFVNSVESGEFRVILRDVQVMRESFDENSVNEASMDLGSIIDTVNTGIKNFYNNFDKDGKAVQVLYKAAGIVALVLSIREIFYALGNMKTKISDMMDGIKAFTAASSSGGDTSKLSRFSSHFKSESEFGTEMAEREMSSENKDITTAVAPTTLKQTYQTPSNTSFGATFDF